MRFYTLLCGAVLLATLAAQATIFGTVRGLIHDPQHRPVSGAQIALRAINSQWFKTTTSDNAGEFRFDAVPVGDYDVAVAVPGFTAGEQKVTISSDRDVNLHFPLAVAAGSETVQVTDTAATVNAESSTTSNIVNRHDIAETPGADQTNSLAMITDYTPSAYMVHDQLHIRGGHQVSWLLDGVPVPNTNIASNVGPQFDPKDIDYLEVQRGGYNAEYGDRTYGVFNVVTRSGFERSREAELVASYGSFNTTNDQISFGDHSQRLAYYGSFSFNRTDIGLETPTPAVINDQSAGLSGFTSLIFNKTPNDQLRVVASARGDHFQVPNTPEQQADGIRDVEDERDDFVNFSWLHTTASGILLTVSPFYHFNRAHYVGGAADTPVAPEDDRGSNYLGGVVSLGVVRGKHNAHVGIQTFAAHDNQLFGLTPADDAAAALRQRETLWGSMSAVFVEDQYKPTSWLTLNGGARLSHFEGSLSENAADPRLGAAVRIPKLGWVARAFWGRYYQAPPLLTVGGPLLDLAIEQGFGFLPLRGERDEQREFGLTIPVAGWSFDVDNFRTAAKNFFDHDVLGNSNIFFPLTIERARIHGWEVTATSPRVAGRAQWHLAYSHQYAEGFGGVTGGLTDFSPPEDAYFFLDHDQRDTLSTGVNLDLPLSSWAAFNFNYGSGFIDGEGPEHLPSHTSYDLSLGKTLREKWTVRLTALNLTNSRYLLDNSNTFGGTHYVNPRMITVQLKYRFRY
ncbi:MAG TPA: TonB-dependent receptor [Terriglobales bacterium]|nr:TonB-dependent receptor [Terriglobales bacterium]